MKVQQDFTEMDDLPHQPQDLMHGVKPNAQRASYSRQSRIPVCSANRMKSAIVFLLCSAPAAQSATAAINSSSI
jgi:hypothetical protein